MSKDLEVIAWLKNENIVIEEKKELKPYGEEEGYIFKEGSIVELKIINRQLNSKTLEVLASLTNLERLYLNSNQITAIPEALDSLTNLERLYLNSNQITAIPEALDSLTNLERLYLNSNQITAIPEALDSLTNLQWLSLSSNQITAISEALASLTNLERLNLGSNQITAIPEALASLTNLERLYLNSNQITAIPEALVSLTKLEWLYLHSNQITAIPEALASLTNLERLFLHSNQITAIPEALDSLTNLQWLSLSSNQITAIPEALASLTNLERLYLNSNQITAIPEALVSLTKLEWLDLDSNQITKIPEALASLTNLERLRLNDNLLPTLSESMEKPSEIIEYLLKHQKSQKRAMNEVKVLVVGDERVGKTSVVRRLTKDEFDENESSTKGVAISPFNINSKVRSSENKKVPFSQKLLSLLSFSSKASKKEIDILSTEMNGVKLNIWDFAGQQVTHTPHQYFMTEQSLYMLVLDAQVEDSKNFYTIRYWLDMIKSYAGSEVPVLIVVNKVDKNSGYRFDIHKYRQTYPNIVEEVLYLSSKNGESFEKLKEVIGQEVATLESVKALFPVSYHAVKSALEDTQKDYIEDKEYFDICEHNGVVEQSDQRLLLSVLNAMGTIVSYSDSLHLDRTYVIDPEWVTNAVYEIIRSEHLKNNHGVLKREDLSKILCTQTYKQEQYSWVIALMERFEVCFSYDDNEVLIPAVFENLEPAIHFEDYKDGYRLKIVYEFLPKSVISKFIVRSKYMIKEKLYWRDGVILEYEGIEAVIKADELSNSIDIYLMNNSTHSRDFLNIIRNEFRAISENKLKYNERVPLYLPQHEGQFIPYKQLEKLEAKGVLKNYFGQPEPEEYEIRKLLHGYEPQENLAKINKLIHYLKSNPSEQNSMFLKEVLAIQEKKEEGIMDRALDGMNKFNSIMKYAKNSHEFGLIIEKLF